MGYPQIVKFLLTFCAGRVPVKRFVTLAEVRRGYETG